MKDAILKLVTERDHVSFVELQNAIGEPARGNVALELPKGSNILLWMGMSPEFVEALLALQGKIVPVPCHILVYLADGAMPRGFPVVKRMPSAAGFKNEHWMPVVWRLRSRVPEPRISQATKTRLDAKLRAMASRAHNRTEPLELDQATKEK